jgi:hypothetical protein
MRWWGSRSADAGGIWKEHELRAGTLVGEVLNGKIAVGIIGPSQIHMASEWTDRLFGGPPEVSGSALLLLIREAASTPLPEALTRELDNLNREPWTITRADAFLAARTAIQVRDSWGAIWPLTTAEVMLRRVRHDGSLTEDEAKVVKTFIASLQQRTYLSTADRNRMRTRLLGLLPASEPGTLNTSAIAPIDAWSAAVLPELAGNPTGANTGVTPPRSSQSAPPAVTYRGTPLSATTRILTNTSATTRLSADGKADCRSSTNPSAEMLQSLEPPATTLAALTHELDRRTGGQTQPSRRVRAWPCGTGDMSTKRRSRRAALGRLKRVGRG